MTALVWGTILAMTVLGALASWMLKLASGADGLAALVRDWHFWLGGLGYGLAAVMNIWVLRHLDLSVVLPVTSITYVWTLVIARVFLGEHLGVGKIAGVAAIVLGVVLIGVS